MLPAVSARACDGDATQGPLCAEHQAPNSVWCPPNSPNSPEFLGMVSTESRPRIPRVDLESQTAPPPASAQQHDLARAVIDAHHRMVLLRFVERVPQDSLVCTDPDHRGVDVQKIGGIPPHRLAHE